MSHHIDPAAHRTKLVNELNAAIANLETARKRVQNAKSQLGTAEAELLKSRAEYERLRTLLLKELPDGQA